MSLESPKPNKNETIENERGETSPLEKRIKAGVWGPLEPEVQSILGGEDPDIRAFEDQMNKNLTLGKAAGRFFEELVPQSLHKPRRPYRRDGAQTYFEQKHQADVSFLRNLSTLPETPEVKKDKEALLNVPKGEFDSGVEELPLKDRDGILQKRTIQSVKNKGDTSITIREIIRNYVFNQQDEHRRRNITTSSLLLTDTNTEKTLDLNQLLPSSKTFQFIPAQLEKREEWFDAGSGEIMKTRVFSDLREYSGSESDETGKAFAFLATEADRDKGSITYGNLTQQGRLLMLLHEIAHSWQIAHGLSYGRANYEFLLGEIRINLGVLSKMRSSSKEPRDKTYYRKHVQPKHVAELEKLGITFDMETFELGDNDHTPEGKIEVRGINGERFVVEGEILKVIINDFVREERDAWAHAIRVLRFLRKQGFDLEPELETLADFRDVVHHALGTYQKYLEQEISVTKDTKPFSIHQQKEKEQG